MILQCPACDVQFKIPDGSLGDVGKRVRCGKCQNLWIARPPKPEMPAPDIDAVLAGDAYGKKSRASKKSGGVIGGYGPPKPFKASKWKWLGYLGSYAVLVLVSIMLWSLAERPNWWGQVPSKGFAFEKMEVAAMAQLGGDRFSANPMYSISGMARNVSHEPKTLPDIKVTLLNIEGEEIYHKRYTVSPKVIPAGETISFVLENLELADRRHTHFIIEMGNRIELALRSVDEDMYAN